MRENLLPGTFKYGHIFAIHAMTDTRASIYGLVVISVFLVILFGVLLVRHHAILVFVCDLFGFEPLQIGRLFRLAVTVARLFHFRLHERVVLL